MSGPALPVADEAAHWDRSALLAALFWAATKDAAWGAWQSANVKTEATWFAKAGKLVVINNAGEPQETVVTLGDGRTARTVRLEAHGIAILDVT